MLKIQTEVLVLGGGATGTGIARDLAMRGFKTALVEKSDLTTGTTGRYHGLLHSGGRYAVKDPQAAAECIQENVILRRILPHCIEDTGGFFVLTPWDDPEYAPRFLEGCHKAGIPVEEVNPGQMLRQEPLLNPKISRCFRVPDGSADSFLAARSNADSARQYGTPILTYHRVIKLLTAEGNSRTVTGALVRDLVKDEEVQINADMVVNAAGAWCGQIAATVGVPINILPGKGVMLAMNHRIVNTVINRCKLPSDGDILVPAHTVAVIGTTDTPVSDPDHFAIEPWEVQLMLEEGEKIIPGFKEMRVLRAWAGVRPLYKDTRADANRDISRAFILLDHERRDGINGLVTITSGKWTTYRKMAEVTVDLVCKKLGVERPCRTAEEALPHPGHAGGHYLGARLASIEKEDAYGQLVCECELATADEVKRAILAGAHTIDDVRRDVRLGMGPCQGGFCTYRVAGMLQALRASNVQDTNAALFDFLQERWKGLLPILWGQQLRQERLDELIYLSVLNAEGLPGPRGTILGSVNYDPAAEKANGNSSVKSASQANDKEQAAMKALASPNPGTLDVLVIGCGFAGLAAALQAAKAGRRVRLVAKGFGSQYWNAGCIDVLGYANERLLPSPADGIADLIQENPQHPYALAGLEAINLALLTFQEACQQAGYPMHGSLERNWLLPTALGSLRPTCLAPETMLAGDTRRSSSPVLIVGFENFPDFYPAWISANLALQGIPAEGIVLQLPSLASRRFVTGRTMALLMDTPAFRREVASAIKPHLGNAARIGLPAVLGLDHPIEALHELQELLGVQVFEIPTLTPSIPGLRLTRLLVKAIKAAGGQVYDGMQAMAVDVEGRQVRAVYTEASLRPKAHRAGQFILATGGILGGGLRAEYDGSLKEMLFDLPLPPAGERSGWLQREYLAPGGHPIFHLGVPVDSSFRPVDQFGQVIYDNLFAAGALLDACDPVRERSLDGAAIVTGYLTGMKDEG